MQISFLKHPKLPDTLTQTVPPRDKDAAAPDATDTHSRASANGLANGLGHGAAAARKAEHHAAREAREKPDTTTPGSQSAAPGVIVTISGNRRDGSANGVRGELVYTNKPVNAGAPPAPPAAPPVDAAAGPAPSAPAESTEPSEPSESTTTTTTATSTTSAEDPLGDTFVGTKSEEFVHYAVATMRQFAEEQERLRKSGGHEGAEGAHLIPRNLGDIQKLASRFKLFA